MNKKLLNSTIELLERLHASNEQQFATNIHYNNPMHDLNQADILNVLYELKQESKKEEHALNLINYYTK